MLENCNSAKERWGGVSEIIDRWLQERQDMLVQYCALSTISEFDENDPDTCSKTRSLCQILMDYTSAGHFEVYGQLIQEAQAFDDQTALQEGTRLIAQLENTTDKVLDFNDKYLETDDLSSLPEDLSAIGETLAFRFEAEDRMIEVLHVAHKELVA